MTYRDLVKKGLLRKEKISFDQINRILERSYRNIKSSKILLEKDEEGSFQFAYQAMLLAARALVFSFGLRPRVVGSHKIVIEFTERVLGKEYKTLIKKFDKMRRKRHYLIYEAELTVSKTEAKNAIKTAEKFLKIIKEIIQKKNPQRKLI